MVSVNTAASYIYEKYKSEFGTTIDEMKLHKLLYFAQRDSIIHTYVWGQTPLKFYKVGKQKEKISIC